MYLTTRKYLLSLMVVVLVACFTNTMVAAGGRRQLKVENVFPLNLQGAADDFQSEFFEEYIEDASWLPDTYEYDDLITEGWEAFSGLFGQFLQNGYNALNPGKK